MRINLLGEFTLCDMIFTMSEGIEGNEPVTRLLLKMQLVMYDKIDIIDMKMNLHRHGLENASHVQMIQKPINGLELDDNHVRYQVIW
jgi:hypothetical protein